MDKAWVVVGEYESRRGDEWTEIHGVCASESAARAYVASLEAEDAGADVICREFDYVEAEVRA